MWHNETGGALGGQLGAIHAMLASGQRSLRLEPHTLILWGGAGGTILALAETIFTADQYPDITARAVIWLVFLAMVFALVASIDYVMTRRRKQARDETWSFIHRQVLKVWWLLFALGIVSTFAMFFFGGGEMIFALWMVLPGLGLYVHGLFSDEVIEWAGVLAVLIGIGSLVFHLTPDTARWLAASLYGIGLPLLAARGQMRPGFAGRAVLLPLWIFAVLLPPLLLRPSMAGDYDLLPTIDYTAWQAGRATVAGRQTLTLPAGAEIPVEITFTGSVVRGTPPQRIVLRSAVPITVLLVDGVPTGELRLGDGPWGRRGSVGNLRIPHVFGDLDPVSGAGLRTEFRITPSGRT